MGKEQDAYKAAANRLHHLSMRYGAALVECAQGRKVGLLGPKYPGLKEFRDLVDLVLLTRAEINAFTNLLIKAGVFTEGDFTRQCTEEYDWLCKQKAQQFGLVVTDTGLTISNEPEKQ